MNHKQQHTLEAIFHDPVVGNIHWKDVVSLMNALGAEVHEGHGARSRVSINGVEGTIHRPHHGTTLSKSDVHALRKYLISAGVQLL